MIVATRTARGEVMKLFVATDTGRFPKTDPKRRPLPGELLVPAQICDSLHCMCQRAFVGVTTYEHTLHAQVAELEVTVDQLRDIARDYVVELFGEPHEDEVVAYLRDMIGPAEDWPVGTVVERWGCELRDITDNPLGADA
jgi:hypothetical protein